MNDQFDQQLDELVRELRQHDADSVPTFEDVLHRPHCPRKPLLNGRVQTVLACLAVILASILWTNTLSPQQAKPTEKEITTFDADFERWHAAVDDHFGSTQKTAWNTPSDALLAMNLDQTFSQEFDHE